MIAVVFPGQGSQSLGMLRELGDEHPLIMHTFEEASKALGYDLWELIQNGPVEQLNQTEYTQPAILTASVALWRLFKDTFERPVLFAGHSLGEYTALVCAESISLKEGVKLVQARGQYMQAASDTLKGSMAAILGLTDDEVSDACQEAMQALNSTSGNSKFGDSKDLKIVSPANYNAPGQVVIAGHADAVECAISKAKEMGAKRAIPIEISVPSHCELMKPAAVMLEKRIKDIPMSLPRIPILHNVDVKVHQTVESIKRILIEQLYKPVQWVDTIQTIAKTPSLNTIFECGPGKVLTALNKRIAPSIQCESIYRVRNGEPGCL